MTPSLRLLHTTKRCRCMADLIFQPLVDLGNCVGLKLLIEANFVLNRKAFRRKN